MKPVKLSILIGMGAAVGAFVSVIISDNNTLADCSVRGESHLRDNVYILCEVKRGAHNEHHHRSSPSTLSPAPLPKVPLPTPPPTPSRM